MRPKAFAAGLPKSEIAGIDAFFSSEGFDVTQLRFESCCSAPLCCCALLGAAGKTTPDKQPSSTMQHCHPQRMRQSRTRPSSLVMALGRDAEQLPARSKQVAGVPCEPATRLRMHDADAADRYRPLPYRCGPRRCPSA